MNLVRSIAAAAIAMCLATPALAQSDDPELIF